MHYTYFEAKNVGPFEHLKLDLTHGSICVVGRNGRGKSTILNLFFALLSNDFGRFDGVKIDCVRNTAGDKDESYVYGRVEHNGRLLSIKRNLRGKPVVSLMVDHSGKEITDVNKAQEEIDRVLGVDRKMLDLYVFKTQDKIYDFLSTTPAERAKALAVLCHTEHCEEVWDYLGRFLNKDVEVNAVIVDDSDELAQAVATLNAKLVDLDSARKVEEGLLLNAKSEQSARNILHRQDTVEQLSALKGKCDARIKTLEESASEWRKKLDVREAKLKKLSGRVGDGAAQADEAKAALSAWASYKKYRQRRRQLKDEAEQLVRQERQMGPPPLPEKLEGVAALDVLNKYLSAWENQLGHARKVVATFQVSGLTECPTCGTPVGTLHDYLEEQRRLVLEMPGQIAAVQDQVDLWDQYNRDVRKYEKWRAGHDARVKANQESRDAMKDVKAPDGDEDELKTALAAYQEQVEEMVEAEVATRKARDAFNEADADLKSERRQLAEIAQALEENKEPAEKVERARRRLDQHLASTRNISRLEGEAGGVRSMVEDKENELKKLRARLKRNKRVRRAVQVVSAARDVLHRDRLPRRVAQSNLAKMEGDINGNLGLFGDPFWVEANEQLSFVVHKPGEPPQPAGRLSTGQRVVLALAFWPAVASLWAQDLGILALDEPTANLDEENRKFLALALGVLSARVRGRRQLIMVTHDHSLRPAFDQVIDLGG
jgi:DNA repair exonuclease SbcCD ATPase subunit